MTDTLDLVARAIGSALVHSLWQGTIIAGLAAGLLRALRGATASTRYLLSCLALVAMVTSWAVTAASASRAMGPTPVVSRQQPAAAFTRSVDLGPAGPDDASPAIRILPPDALEQSDATWTRDLEAWSVAAVPLWLAGVLLLSLRLGMGWLLVERVRRSAAPASSALARQVAMLADKMRIRRVIRVAQSAAVQVPTVIGWLRPVVLLPLSALSGLTTGQIESILAHELAHIRRHDYMVNVLQSAAEVVLFYHPACWWLSRRIRVEREHCCDDVAIAVSGDRLAYAAALADLESLRGRPALALGVTDGPLLQRVRRLIAGGGHGPEPSAWAVAAAPLAVMALVLVSAQVASTAPTGEDLAQSSVPTAARLIPADEGIIQGRAVEASSARPVPNATVLIMGQDSAVATTDQEGRYEAGGLKPGSYRLSVRAKGYVEGHYGQTVAMPMDFGAMVVVRGGAVTRGIDVGLQRAGSVSGRVTDAEGRGLAGIEVELMTDMALAGGARAWAVAFAQTTEEGAYRMSDVRPGDYYVRAYTTRDAEPAGQGPPLAYASTFYPGVPAVEEAFRLRLDSGQELLDLDFALATTRKFRVSGTVVDPSGEPLGDVSISMHGMAASGGPMLNNLSSALDKDGHFEIRDIVPGDYMFNVRDRRRTARWVSAMRIMNVDRDLTDVEIRATLGARVEGRIVRAITATKTLDPTSVHVGFEKRLELGGFTGSNFTVGADGGFSTESPGGPVRFTVKDIPAGWMVKSITLDGAEIDDEAIDFGSGRRQVEVVLTDKVSGVSGMIVDRNGRALPNSSVVVFPADRSRWHQSSRFILSARSDNAGRFRLDAVPPGLYLAVAVAGLPMNAWQNPEVLERLQTGAEQIRVGEGERLTISIRASPTPAGLGASVQPQLFLLGVERAPGESGAAGSARVRRTNRKSAAGV